MRPTATPDPVSADGDNAPRTLVVPLDGSDFAARAVPVARWFARAFGAEVVALTTPHSIDPSTRDETPAWLGALIAEPSDVPVRASVAATVDVADAVVAELAAHPDAAVCMTTHGAIGSGVLGNVAQEILRRADVPVLLVGRHCATDQVARGPVVVSHDGSAAADAVLAPARAWAHACDVPLVLVHAYHPLDAASSSRPDAVLDEARRRLGPSARLEVVATSFAAGAIRDVAHELGATLVALATHGHTGSAAVSMGRVASWVTRESPCPVLVVRPATLSG
jgi:nucleotide-binding universal stress UspA family protein